MKCFEDLHFLSRLTSPTCGTAILVRRACKSDIAELTMLLNAVIAVGGTTALERFFQPEDVDERFIFGPRVLSCMVALDHSSETPLCFQSLISSPTLPAGCGDIATFNRIGAARRGMGSVLFEHTKTNAAMLGLDQINATIRADNVGGLAFYSRLGFVDHHVDFAVPLKNGTLVDRISKRYALDTFL